MTGLLPTTTPVEEKGFNPGAGPDTGGLAPNAEPAGVDEAGNGAPNADTGAAAVELAANGDVVSSGLPVGLGPKGLAGGVDVEVPKPMDPNPPARPVPVDWLNGLVDCDP